MAKMPPAFLKKAPPFEKSGKEKGVKEGGKKDMAADKKQGKFPAFLKKGK